MNSKKVALPPCDILIYETFHNKYISKGQIIKFNGLQSTKANMEYISDDLFLLEKDKEIDIKQQSNSFANNDAYRNLVFLVKTTMWLCSPLYLSNKHLEIVPGEVKELKNTPLGKYCEEVAFSHLLRRGRNGYQAEQKAKIYLLNNVKKKHRSLRHDQFYFC